MFGGALHAAPKLGFHLNVACPGDYHPDLHDLAKGGKPLLGLRGMAKLYGKPQPLGLNLLRTPIQAVRQWLGI